MLSASIWAGANPVVAAAIAKSSSEGWIAPAVADSAPPPGQTYWTATVCAGSSSSSSVAPAAAVTAAKCSWDQQNPVAIPPPTVHGWQQQHKQGSSGHMMNSSSSNSSSSSSWNNNSGTPSSVISSWTNAPMHQWNAVNQSANSWSDVARKNVPQHQQQQTVPTMPMSAMGSGGSSSSSSRAKNAAGGSYDVATDSWGKPVDQGTPWDVGVGVMVTTTGTKTSEWSNAAVNSGWNSASAMKGHVPHVSNSSVSGSTSGGGGGGGGYWKSCDRDRWAGSVMTAAGSSGWDDPNVMCHRPNSSWVSNAESASNVWTGPPMPADASPDNSMVWNNPYPKKTAQPDKGTSLWGDPNAQGEIHRWKNSSDDSTPTVLQTEMALPPPAVFPCVSSSSSTSVLTSTATGDGNASSLTKNSVWNDSPIAPQPVKLSTGGGSSGVSWNAATAEQQSATSVAKSSTTATTAVSSVSSGSVTLNSVAATSCQSVTSPDCKNWLDTTGKHTSSVCSASSQWSEPVSGGGSAKQERPSENASDSADFESVTNDEVFVSSSATSASFSSVKAVMPSGMPSNNIPPVVAQLQQQGSKSALNNPQLQMLTQQIADQLCAAVRAGLVDLSILQHPLPQETLLKLNHLLQFVPKLEKVKLEIQKLQQKVPLNMAQQNELQRHLLEMHQLKNNIQTLKMQISAQTSFPSVNLRSPGVGSDSCYPTDNYNQSKLLQWKQSLSMTGSNEVSSDRNKLNTSVSVPNLENLENVLVNLNLGAVKDPWSMKRGSLLEWPQELQSKGNRGAAGNTNSGNMSVDGCSSGADSDVSSGGGGGGFVSSFDEGPPEFRPGQKWEWKDPKEVADDPNATPGSVKPSSISLNRLNPDYSTLTSTGFMNNCMPSFPFNASFVGMPNTGGGRSSYESKQHSINQNVGSCGGDNWGTRSSRSHAQMHQSMNRYPFSSASSSGASSFVPFNNRSCGNQWIVLVNLNQVDEQTLQLIFSRIGNINAFFYPPGAGFAAIRFKDAITDKVISRIHQEFAPIGVTVQLAKDAEVERLIQSFPGPRQQQPSSAYGHTAATHVSHGAMMWELPPPHSGQWPGNSAPPPPPPPFTGPPGIPLADPIALMHHGVGPIFNDGLYSTDRQPTFS